MGGDEPLVKQAFRYLRPLEEWSCGGGFALWNIHEDRSEDVMFGKFLDIPLQPCRIVAELNVKPTITLEIMPREKGGIAANFMRNRT